MRCYFLSLELVLMLGLNHSGLPNVLNGGRLLLISNCRGSLVRPCSVRWSCTCNLWLFQCFSYFLSRLDKILTTTVDYTFWLGESRFLQVLNLRIRSYALDFTAHILSPKEDLFRYSTLVWIDWDLNLICALIWAKLNGLHSLVVVVWFVFWKIWHKAILLHHGVVPCLLVLGGWRHARDYS